MKFLNSLALVVATASVVSADLRQASQPKNDWKVVQRNKNVPFKPTVAYYMEPSDFGYAGLKKQRDGGGYDNFLRSNIDNEQDKRNFVEEDGKDHLPFRSFESASTDAHASVKAKLPAAGFYSATPGTPLVVPLRWNNPHSSEIEVNIWVSQNKYVVPIRKPACSGEGHQDNVFEFIVPNDFNAKVAAAVPGFAGCKNVGDCVLQIYAHSVESRTYAIGVPIKIDGTVPPAVAAPTGIQEAPLDVGLDLSKLSNIICLSSADPAVHITSAVVYKARMVSDQFNHAYQNSDYSPYSGQQATSISRNLQAACILKMVTGDRGELGKALLATKKGTDKSSSRDFQKRIEKKTHQLIRIYESVVNQIIEAVDDIMKNTDANLANAPTSQKTETCFRCAEVGAVVAKRLTTNTYIPSFQIKDAAALDIAKKYIAPIYSKILDANGYLKIYESVLEDMQEQFVTAGTVHKLGYQGPAIKQGLGTLADATNFKKKNAAGAKDNGLFAATEAAKTKAADILFTAAPESALKALLQVEESVFITEETADMSALNGDSTCDNDKTWTPELEAAGQCSKPQAMFAEDGAPLSAPLNSAASAGASALATLLAMGAAFALRQ